MKKLILIFIIFTSTDLTAQVITAVAPLKPGNKWVYTSSVVFQNSVLKFEVTDSIKVINGMPFYSVLTGKDLGYTEYMGVTSDQYLARYSDIMDDSLYRYFKININKGNSWEQRWFFDKPILYSTVTDTFLAQVFGINTVVYVVDRTDSGVVGSREFWTKEFGLIEGRYEQAEDYLRGCVIDGVLYGDTNTVVGIDEIDKQPSDFVLYQNYPNPFNPSTVISWEVAVGGFVTLKVFDVLGREIKTLVNQFYNHGKYSITFNAEGLPSGIYFYSITAGSFRQTKKMIMLR